MLKGNCFLFLLPFTLSEVPKSTGQHAVWVPLCLSSSVPFQGLVALVGSTKGWCSSAVNVIPGSAPSLGTLIAPPCLNASILLFPLCRFHFVLIVSYCCFSLLNPSLTIFSPSLSLYHYLSHLPFLPVSYVWLGRYQCR